MLFEMFLVFAKIGAFTIGGGYAMIPLIQREIVNNKAWIEKKKFLDYIALAQSSPGPMSINLSILVGHEMGGLKGAVIACLGCALPSVIIILLVAMFFMKVQHNPYVIKAFAGIRPAVSSLILIACISMYRQVKKGIFVLGIVIVTAVLVAVLHINPIILILTGGIGGYMYHRTGLCNKEESEDGKETA